MNSKIRIAVLFVVVSFCACAQKTEEPISQEDAKVTGELSKMLFQGLHQKKPPVEQPPKIQKPEEQVTFNTKNSKYHCASCRWALKCTRNCVSMSISQARARGGVPCRVCGGSCR